MTSNPKNTFDLNLESVKILDNIYTYFESKVPALDISEILRAEFVLIVSAFDCFIHDIVREGMLEVFDGTRNENNKYKGFKISLNTLKIILSATDEDERKRLLSAEIRNLTTKDSYQSPRSIETALQLISIKNIWAKISPNMEKQPDEVRRQLGLIVNRRNKIAHEADINSLTGEKNPIERNEIIETMEFIEKIVDSIILEM